MTYKKRSAAAKASHDAKRKRAREEREAGAHQYDQTHLYILTPKTNRDETRKYNLT